MTMTPTMYAQPGIPRFAFWVGVNCGTGLVPHGSPEVGEALTGAGRCFGVGAAANGDSGTPDVGPDVGLAEYGCADAGLADMGASGWPK